MWDNAVDPVFDQVVKRQTSPALDGDRAKMMVVANGSVFAAIRTEDPGHWTRLDPGTLLRLQLCRGGGREPVQREQLPFGHQLLGGQDIGQVLAQEKRCGDVVLQRVRGVLAVRTGSTCFAKVEVGVLVLTSHHVIVGSASGAGFARKLEKCEALFR